MQIYGATAIYAGGIAMDGARSAQGRVRQESRCFQFWRGHVYVEAAHAQFRFFHSTREDQNYLIIFATVKYCYGSRSHGHGTAVARRRGSLGQAPGGAGVQPPLAMRAGSAPTRRPRGGWGSWTGGAIRGDSGGACGERGPQHRLSACFLLRRMPHAIFAGRIVQGASARTWGTLASSEGATTAAKEEAK